MTSLPVSGEQELRDLKAFLKLNKLPFEDICLDGNQFFLYYLGGTLVGCGGLEYHGDHALLRSLAVAEHLREKHYGVEIAKDLIERARCKSLWSVSLLTETAPVFFEKLGFRKVARDSAPKEIKASSEFSSVCPVSAVFMSIDLANKTVL